MNPPRQFVASAAEPPKDLDPDASELVGLAGVLSIENRSGADEHVLGTTVDGDLLALPAHTRGALAPPLQAALAHHEVARAGERPTHPLLLAEEVHLLRVELLEEAPDAPGLNDPVYLYGTLSGPFPRTDETRSVRGQLTVSRADVLGGFLLGARWPFHLERTDTASFRCFLGVLPGDRAETLASGRGVVLALPWLDGLEVPGNELFVAQILYDLLDAVQEELRAIRSTSAFAKAIVPVPSRAAFVRDLEADGFTVEGDIATRTKATTGLVSRWFGGRERVVIPRQARIEDLLQMAELALRDLGAPSPARLALGELIDPPAGARHGILSRFIGHARATRARAAPAAAAPTPTASARPVDEGAARRAPRSEWMNDFVDRHRVPDRAPPRLSSPTRAAPRASLEPSPARAKAEPSRPDWMKDFE